MNENENKGEVDELEIASEDINGIQLQIRFAGKHTGGAVEYFVNGREVNDAIYDRVLATAKLRTLEDIANSLHPNTDDGVVFQLNNIYCALNQNENGDHPTSLVDAIKNLTASLPES